MGLLSGFILGIVIGRHLPGHHVAAWLLAAFCAAWMVYFLRRGRGTALAPILLFAALGYNAISPVTLPEFPPNAVTPFLDNGPYAVSGRIARSPAEESYRTRCILADLHVKSETDGRPRPLPGRLRANLYGKVPPLTAGTRIELNDEIRSFKNFRNPGGFDYKQYMADRRIWGTVYGTADDLAILSASEANIKGNIGEFRTAVGAAIGKVAADDAHAVLSALIVGKKDRITPTLRDAFSRAGVSHLLAISGLHIGIVATCAFLFLRWFFGRSSYLLRRGWGKKAAAAAALLPVAGYGLVSGMSPSTQRAVIMVGVFLAAFLLDREYDPANTLATAALAILAAAPAALFNVSFQLSFAAVAAILYGLYMMPVQPGGGASFAVRAKNTLLGFTAVSAFAIVGTMPLVTHYFNQVSLLGLLSNLLLVPLIGFVVVPVGLMSTLLYACWTPAGMWGYTAASLILKPGLAVVDYIADLPFGSFKTVTPSVLEVTCLYGLLIGIPLCLAMRKSVSAESGEALQRHCALPSRRSARLGVAALTVVVGLILAADGGYWVHRRYLHPDLRTTILDVGQGSAALVEFPGGKTMLIDGGGFSNNDIFDVGRLIVAPYLWRNKIARLDTVILSHPDADHLNGLIYILEHFKVGRVICAPWTASTDEYRRFRSIINEKRIACPSYDNLPRQTTVNGVTVEILYPPALRKSWLTSEKTNNASIVVRISHCGTEILFPGDIEAAAEHHLIDRAGDRLAADVLIAPHHGSNTSSSPAFLNTVNPELAIFSVRTSRFGQPPPEVLARYTKRNIETLQTDSHGAVRIYVNKAGRRIMTTVDG